MTAKEVEKLINFLGQMANLPLVDGERKLSNFVYTIITTQRKTDSNSFFMQFYMLRNRNQTHYQNPVSNLPSQNC